VQVDPIKPTLMAPRTTRLKLKYDKLLSSVAFKFNLRSYTEGLETHRGSIALGRGLHSSTCRLNVSAFVGTRGV